MNTHHKILDVIRSFHNSICIVMEGVYLVILRQRYLFFLLLFCFFVSLNFFLFIYATCLAICSMFFFYIYSACLAIYLISRDYFLNSFIVDKIMNPVVKTLLPYIVNDKTRAQALMNNFLFLFLYDTFDGVLQSHFSLFGTTRG